MGRRFADLGGGVINYVYLSFLNNSENRFRSERLSVASLFDQNHH